MGVLGNAARSVAGFRGRLVAARAKNQLTQLGADTFVAPLGENSPRTAHIPVIGVCETIDKLGAGQRVQIYVRFRPGAAGLDAKDPAVRSVPLRVGVGVRRPLVMPVGNVDGSIGPESQVAGRKPRVV